MSGVVLLPTRTSSRAPLPRVLLNLAITADGKIATANRRISSFGSCRDQAHLHALRATVDAILCGAETLRSGNVTLDLAEGHHRRWRRARGLSESPLRLVVSGSGALDPALPIFRDSDREAAPRQDRSPVIILTTRRCPPAQRRRLATVAREVMVCGERQVDWPLALAYLRKAWRIQRLLCEGGGELNDALFRAGLVCEVHLTICPFLFGGRTAPTLADGLGFPRLRDAASFRLVRHRRIGDELFCVFQRIPG